MKKILPISSSPITSYPHYADTFSIIGAQSNHHIPWIYNYFVQLFVPNDMGQGLRIDYVAPDVFIFLPYLETNFISRDIALHRWNGIINFIRDYYNKNHVDGAILGISGGKDSGVVAGLFVEALGKENVIGVTLPCHSVETDKNDAKLESDYYGFPL